jgi:hypothetical protein
MRSDVNLSRYAKIVVLTLDGFHHSVSSQNTNNATRVLAQWIKIVPSVYGRIGLLAAVHAEELVVACER